MYDAAGDLDRALHHYRQAIRMQDKASDTYGAGATRFNVAAALLDAGRFADARAYAEAALANYSTFGDRAAADIERTQRLLARIAEAAAATGGPPP